MKDKLRRYAVFGNPISHSRSPEIHQQFALQAGISIEYQKIEAPLDGFALAMQQFIEKGGQGFNITLPFKEAAYAIVQGQSEGQDIDGRLSSDAFLSGAVNTITVNQDKSLNGDNTDGCGLVRDIVRNLGWTLEGQRVLLVGAGGAVRGVIPALMIQKPASLVIANRTVSRAETLVDSFSKKINAGNPESDGYDIKILQASGLAELKTPFDLIINGTSAGLTGNIPELPEGVVVNSRCYDMIYGSTGEETAFVKWARQAGADRWASGLGMLVEQAAESFRIWTGFEADTLPLLKGRI